MSKADEMLKKLGYILDYEATFINDRMDSDELITRYINTTEIDEIHIDFWNDKTFSKTRWASSEGLGYITMQELQAINEKCKELGWIESNKKLL